MTATPPNNPTPREQGQSTDGEPAPPPGAFEDLLGAERSGLPASSFHLPSDEPQPTGDRPSTLADTDPALGYLAFDLAEAVMVLSHYDLGIVQAVREFRRGSRHSPKLLIKCEKGGFVLKRRAHGRDDPIKVSFTHSIQRHLAKAGYPLARLALTRSGNESMLSIGGRMYELFEYIHGQPYDQSLHATFESGQALAMFHRILADVTPEWEPPTGSYHRSQHVPANLNFIPHRLQDDTLDSLIATLRESYQQAGEAADALGFQQWPRQITHGDWHPGNMLFRNSKVVAVIDYDTARVQPRALDIANGTLQFSITRTGDNPDSWPAEPDESRFKRFLRGYDSMAHTIVSTAELEAVPWLMIEAMIAEAAVPIAATGRFGRLDARSFLKMVLRKVRWLQGHRERMHQLVS